MHWNLNNSYIPSYTDCMQNKSMISKPVGPLHSLSVSNNCFNSININFIGSLSKNEGYDMLIIATNWLGSTDIHLISCHTTNTALEIAYLFFDNWYYENRLSLEIISN